MNYTGIPYELPVCYDVIIVQEVAVHAQVVDTDVEVVSSSYSLGPVEGGTAGTVTVKTEQFPLPANALVS